MIKSPTVTPVETAESLFGASTEQLARFAVSNSQNWSAFNPSICHTEKYGTLVLFRSSNGVLKDHRPEFQMPLGFELDGGDNYRYPSEYNAIADLTTTWEGEPRYHNRMFIARMKKTSNTKVTELCEVDLSEAYAQAPAKMVRGVEDGRLFWDGEDLYIVATAYETREIPSARVCMIKLELPDGDYKKARGTTFQLFDSPNNRMEKNWMPVHREGMMKEPLFDFVYESGYTYSIKSQSLTSVGGYILPLRGGSQLLPLEDGTYLGITHQLTLNDIMRFSDIKKSPLVRRRYIHRFVQYTEQGQVFQVTDPFNFLNKSIEFAAGMAIRDKKLLVSFGVLDCSAHVAVMNLSDVLDSLRRPKLTNK